ncbi:MAG: acireductone synthase, partial [Candidatus Eremiobacteraeota bacterium]|nr:acireductone synthase [Candidatus Eremiobacteraeota bacterium]
TLFAHSDQGDLLPLFSGHFDTTTGPKREPASYAAIVEAIGLAPGDVLFLSDVDAELDAARAIGLQTLRMLRPADTPPDATTTHPSAVSFDQLDVVPH